VVKAMREGKWLVLEELNLAPTEVLEALNLYLVHGKLIFNQGSKRIELSVENGGIHKDFRLFATMNPAYYSGREEMSEALLGRFIHKKIYLTDKEQQEELTRVAQIKFNIEPIRTQQVIQAHMQLVKRARTWRNRREAREPYEFNLRHILRFKKRLDGFNWSKLSEEKKALTLAAIFWDVYADTLRTPDRKTEMFNVIVSLFQLTDKVTPEKLTNFFPLAAGEIVLDKHGQEFLKMGGVKLNRGSSNDFQVPGSEHELAPIRSTRLLESKIMRSLFISENILLSGPPGGSKTSVVFDLYRQLRRPLHYVNLHGTADYESLVGGHTPTKKKGVYEYKKGPLIHALERGEALFIDELNLSEMPEWFNTVLDDGVLYLPGMDKPIRAVEGFVVIAAGNPAAQEGRQSMSPALRSRFKEIWVDEIDTPEELTEIVEFKLQIENQSDLASNLVQFHLGMQKKHPKAGFDLRTLLRWVSFINQNHALLGDDKSVWKGALINYGGRLSAIERKKLIQANAIAGDEPLEPTRMGISPEIFFDTLMANLPKSFVPVIKFTRDEFLNSAKPDKRIRALISILPIIESNPTLLRLICVWFRESLEKLGNDDKLKNDLFIEMVNAVSKMKNKTNEINCNLHNQSYWCSCDRQLADNLRVIREPHIRDKKTDKIIKLGKVIKIVNIDELNEERESILSKTKISKKDMRKLQDLNDLLENNVPWE
jgi:MoxR-like ATPase